jgi:crotonobetainyl-CoA:carnitine CoA-transferase CaiB-like acyl-CoA transferase
MMAEFCKTRTRDQVIQAITGIGLGAERVLTPGEMVQDQHVQARGTIQEARQSSGAVVKTEGPAAKMSRTPVSVRRVAAPHGTHTDEVLKAAGFSDQERAALREEGII